jgi:hypothetical protein
MFSPSKALIFVMAAGLWAQAPDVSLDPRTAFKVSLPGDAPVTLVNADWGQSKATARGGALQVDLHSAVQLRNAGSKKIRGVSLLVLAQEVTPGGKASVTVPSLDVEPGETFAVKIDLRLLRPLNGTQGALAEVSLDGVLFDDLGFYGPNRLNSRRSMTAWEMEARRDRKYFLAVLEQGGSEALRKEMAASLARLASQPRAEMQTARVGRATVLPVGAEEQMEFAFLQLPEAPVELLNGFVRVAGSEARLPRMEMLNRSRRPVRHLEVGWILKDALGKEYHAGEMPAEVNLAPGAKGELVKDATLKFSQPIAGLKAFVANVEYSDGTMWVPGRNAVLPVSPEEQRLAEMYRRKGLDAVTEQLRRLR